jgi:poly(ADP-ribose) glycohydrolase ARH3
LLGEAIGDGLGAPFEGIKADMLPEVVADGEIVPQQCDRLLRYTDDTQMMIGVAETLAQHGRIVEEESRPTARW